MFKRKFKYDLMIDNVMYADCMNHKNYDLPFLYEYDGDAKSKIIQQAPYLYTVFEV